eukprot:CAMPEP_0181305178 /NCGR_PEP_ID=MMETSP1101-20121128/9575_1 /TAXON_ID=46948 /ORGANISM="Rhodomonas abbreviata, Strain Caron Lab Isolate" /LENGTH=1380 /DNA_ID=CAMNT_0023411045 /DNA_START=444 /DNA_END=4586 /DNA_ORIENTATION=+
MTGRDSYFPTKLPEPLRVRYLTPDSTHPNLAFWYTPEVFERDGTHDGAHIEEWPNVANFCYHGHTDTDSCTWDKNQGSQINNNKFVEALKQQTAENKPAYKKDVINGHGVVRFTRSDKLGSTGQYLEMVKRCNNLQCTCDSNFTCPVNNTAGFLTDWTNSATPANTEFTMVMALKTNQQMNDVNPMGVVNLVNGASKEGFGLYKTEAKCKSQFNGTLTGTNQLDHPVTFLSQNGPSDLPGIYNGLAIHIYDQVTDAQTGVRHVATACKVKDYLVHGEVKSALSGTLTTVTLTGGAGAIGWMTAEQIIKAQPIIRFQSISTAHAVGDVQVTSSAANANGVDTDLTIASTNFATTIAAGTSVYVGLEAGEFHTAFIHMCESFNTTLFTGAGEKAFDLVQAKAPGCQQGTFRQMSTMTAYYGGVKDDDGDPGCDSECYSGCDPTAAQYGNSSCVKKWGSRRQLQDPDSAWRVVSVLVSGGTAKVYVDGVHDGCESADGCSIVPPVDISGATPVTLESLRIGLMSAAGATDQAFASMDLAELLVYNTALSSQELDRIGNYLAKKYKVDNFEVNSNIRSSTRSSAVSRHAGCDKILFKTHSAKVCEGFDASECITTSSTITLSDLAAEESTTDYYKGMRLTITGGGDANDGSSRSAAGQSCVVTGYAPVSKRLTCDLSNAGKYGFMLYGNETYTPNSNPAPTNAVGQHDTTIHADWAPDWAPPYYAVLGDPVTAPREVVRVTAASVVGTVHALTVERAMNPTAKAAVSLADAQAKAEAAKITYSRSYLPMDAAANDRWVLVNDMHEWAVLPAETTNLWVTLTGTGAGPPVERLQVSKAIRVSFELVDALANGDAQMNISLLSNFPVTSLLSGDLLRVGDLAGGEIVALSGACTGQRCPITRAQSGTAAAASMAAGTTVTLIERTGIMTNPVYLLVNSTNTGIANSYTASNGIVADFAWAPLGTPVTSLAFKGASGVSEYHFEACDPTATPFLYDSPIQIVSGHQYLKSPGTGYGSSDTADTRTTANSFWVDVANTPDSTTGTTVAAAGTILEIKGWFFMPTDLDLTSSVASSYLDGAKSERNENYLLVTVGHHDPECDPTAVLRCGQEYALTCNIAETPGGYCATDWDTLCRCADGATCPSTCGAGNACVAGPPDGSDHLWQLKTKPSIRCELPETLEADQDLNIFWHGIHTKLSHWFHPKPPAITQLVPARVPYKGMVVVTIRGNDFGPKEMWTTKSAGGRTTVQRRAATVELRGRGMAAKCEEVTHVSNRELLCKVPPLALSRQIDLNPTSKTVQVHVIVDKGGKQSRQTSADLLTYEMVPGYFACESRTVTSLDKNSCFQCCRSACIVDEFATGAKKGGTTYAHCDSTCNKYCGITPAGRAR